MVWIDYKKAYDMVPHSWIIKCLDLFGVAENIKSFLVNSMKKWKVMLLSYHIIIFFILIKRTLQGLQALQPNNNTKLMIKKNNS